ncbi:hypothetical protein IEZ26_06205 [Nocardioides cavernae]|uniref:Uncharacterized protein n=1 Tax=Nocardioides cavernae TaxID=1921566 RepID=A0ABR8N7R5_9ACTN|nr:hypothetical protein [Nocardioides cavernae]MBD3924206.1 hypothetical protein [Nocardioides cavernae]MBM7510856.1 hypothetical protein [Nocardioides cavernae]
MDEGAGLISEAARRAAHILLDSIEVWGRSEAEGLAESELVVQRLLAADAVTIAQDPSSDQVTVDVSGLLQGATNAIVMLVSAVAASTPGGTSQDVIDALRTQVDAISPSGE